MQKGLGLLSGLSESFIPQKSKFAVDFLTIPINKRNIITVLHLWHFPSTEFSKEMAGRL